MKRKESLHIIIIQKLFTPIWLRQFNKVVDCNFLISPIQSFWNAQNHEHLIVGFVFPFLHFRPWQLQGTPKMLAMGRELSKMFSKEKVESGDLLCKFLLEYRTLSSLPQDVVWKMLYYGNEIPFSRSLPCDQIKRKRKSRGDRETFTSVERKSKRPK